MSRRILATAILGGAALVVALGAGEEGLAGSPEEAVGEAGAGVKPKRARSRP